jgi:hypothetical protein
MTVRPDPVDALTQLATMRERGLITAEEYDAKKAELLGRIGQAMPLPPGRDVVQPVPKRSPTLPASGRSLATTKTWLLVLAGLVAIFAVINAVAKPTVPLTPATSRCETVPAALVSAISTGLEGGTNLSKSSAVRSTAFEKVWFVAAEIDARAWRPPATSASG